MAIERWFGVCERTEADLRGMLEGDVEVTRDHRLLCLGPVDLLNSDAGGGGAEPLVLLELPRGAPEGPLNTVRVPLGGWGARCHLIDRAGRTLRTGRLRAEQLFDHMQVTDGLRDEIAAAGFASPRPQSIVPLFLARYDVVRTADVVFRSNWHLFSQVRFSPVDALFIRTTVSPFLALEGEAPALAAELALEPADHRSWIVEAHRRHRAEALFLNNFQCYYRKCHAEQEIEIKFTFDGVVDIWGLTAELYRCIEDGDLQGYATEYRDEFQQWDYPTQLFEITDPAPERGYVAFIPTTDGRHIVKRKWFEADALVRRESISSPRSFSLSYADYLRSELDATFRPLPPARRVRYDVNFESMRTGHVYGIFFDCFSVTGAEGVEMRQCELEYRRSRTVVPPDSDAVFEELEDILAWLRRFLDRHGLRYREGYYSKLSFLRDCVEQGRVPEAEIAALEQAVAEDRDSER